MEQQTTKQKIMRILLLLICLIATSYVQAQTVPVSGRVTDVQNNGVMGVNVFVKGTVNGTVSDLEGNYTINSSGKDEILVFSAISYKTTEVEIGDQRIINVVLEEDTKSLDEVVVIGYGTQKKSDLTGAVTTVQASELTKIPTSSLENALQGKASGVLVSRATGAPGARTSVRIRGISSFNGGTALWVIDGVPGNPNSVNMNDIESMEILKDASTSAIYGSAGANGVILVTTKKGSKDKLELSFNAYSGVQEVGKMISMANGTQMAHYINEAEIIKGTSPRRLSFPKFDAIDSLPSYDHLSNVFRTAPIKGYNLGLANGNENSNMYFGIGYFSQDGIVQKSDYKKLNLRLNSELKVKNWLTIGENISFENTRNHGFAEWVLTNIYHGPIIHAATFMPFQPLFTEDGEYISDMFGHPNPQATIDHASNQYNTSNSGKATVYAIFTPVKGLSFKSSLTGDLGLTDDKTFTDIYKVLNSIQKNDRSVLNAGMSKSTGWRTQNTASYAGKIANDFNLSVMVGQEAGYGKWFDYRGTRKDLLNNSELMWYPNASLDAATDTVVVPDRFFSGTGEENAFYSYFGRVSFDYKSKYLIQANLRNDQSSRFGPDHRSGYFPSFSAGWKFTEEEFLNDIDWLSFGKIRYGWGKAGNDNISPYGFYSTVMFNPTLDYSFSNGQQILVGAAPNQLVNREVHWETIVTSNLGLDLAFLQSKLTLSVDYFTRENEEMLMRVNIPSIAGWKVLWGWQEGGEAIAFQNVGKLRNSGVEISASYKEQIGSKLNFNVQANYTYIKNEVLDIKGDTLYDGGVRGVTGYLTRTHEGGGIGDFYGRVAEGIFSKSDGYYNPVAKTWVITNQPYTINPTSLDTVYAQSAAQPGDYKWKDINGDGKINDRDKKVLGNPHPKHLLGMNLNFSYGIFDMTMFWQGAFGYKIMNGLKANLLGESTDGTKNLPLDFINSHYRDSVFSRDGNLYYPANYNAEFARYDRSNKNQNFNTFSNIYIEDGGYLRLKTLQLGMQVPADWTRKIDVGSIRFYVNVTNLLTFTRYSGLDPEMDTSSPLNSGMDPGIYPVARTFTAGIDIKF